MNCIKGEDLTGKKFGRLTVDCKAPDYISPTGKKYSRWRCVCECGNAKDIMRDNLVGGRVSSCGCYKKEYMSVKQSTHCSSSSKLYGVWCSMKSRCNNINDKHYLDYGARGISVCNEWNCDYTSFEEWALDNGYADGLSIDRIDNDGGYNPSNCRWTSRKVQAGNRRSNRVISFRGESHTLSEWSDIVGINYKTLHNRIRSGWTVERALTENTQKHNQ